jgi:hypothetical protein
MLPPERWYLPTTSHGITTQKTNMVTFAFSLRAHCAKNALQRRSFSSHLVPRLNYLVTPFFFVGNNFSYLHQVYKIKLNVVIADVTTWLHTSSIFLWFSSTSTILTIPNCLLCLHSSFSLSSSHHIKISQNSFVQLPTVSFIVLVIPNIHIHKQGWFSTLYYRAIKKSNTFTWL